MQESLNYGFFFYHFVVEWLGFILAYTAWSLEISVIQSLVQKQKSVALPKWSFDVVTPSAAEQEQCFAERIQTQLTLDNFGKSVNGTTKVGVAHHGYTCISVVRSLSIILALVLCQP